MAKIRIAGKSFEYPANHKVGMIVPQNGSDCQKCEYWKNNLCQNEYFKKWNGSGEIPVKPDRYCCDFFESSK